jgi:NAD-dependent DNA ligase
MKASTRQKKMLRFFGIQFSPDISAGAAGWEIGNLMHDEQNAEAWRKYVFLTRDFDSDSDQIKTFSPEELAAVAIPDDWSQSEAMAAFRDEIAAEAMADGSPFDAPQPLVCCEGRTFMFTGNFDYGSRTACQAIVTERGGNAPSTKTVTAEIDYLVIGSKGSATWKRGSYGNKIEAAILHRRQHGSPAIISEAHWLECLGES